MRKEPHDVVKWSGKHFNKTIISKYFDIFSVLTLHYNIWDMHGDYYT